MKLRLSNRTLWLAGGALLIALAMIFYATLPMAEVSPVRRGTAVAAVYGTVRIEPTEQVKITAQNAGFIHFAEAVQAGRGAIGRSLKKGELLATIADEMTARQLQQARGDFQAARARAELPLPSAEPLKVAEDNVARLERLTSLSNVPAVEYEKAKSEVNRLRGLVESERIERDRNLDTLDATVKKLEAQMRNTEIRAPLDGLLTNIGTIDGELVAEGKPLFTVSSHKNYVRGEVNEEDVGEVKPGMKARLQLYAFRTRDFTATVSAIQPAADPDTQRYTIVLDLENPPENLMAGMTGEMNIIIGEHPDTLLVPTRALLTDQALIVAHGRIQSRTVRVGYRTLDFAEVLSGLKEGELAIISDQDRLRPGNWTRRRIVNLRPPQR